MVRKDVVKNAEVETANDTTANEVEATPDSNEPIAQISSLKELEMENEKHYRKQREFEMKDSLAIQMLNLANDTHTTALKEKAAEYLLSRFN